MVTGFEEFTRPLTDYELQSVVPRVERILQTARGQARSLTNRKILESLRYYRVKSSEAGIRSVIHYLRVNGRVPRLIAGSSGYWIAESEEEVCTYIRSLKERASSIGEVIRALSDQVANQDIQQELFS